MVLWLTIVDQSEPVAGSPTGGTAREGGGGGARCKLDPSVESTTGFFSNFDCEKDIAVLSN